jgi:hypothetical protein
MDEKTGLHTAARRYCLRRAPGLDPQLDERWYRDRRWRRRDLELAAVMDRSRGTAAQLTFLGELLVEIEKRVPADFPSVEAMRVALAAFADHALSVCKNADEEYEQECVLFKEYLSSLAEANLRTVTPLPYRRVLKEQERAAIWQRVEQRWGISPTMNWYPLTDQPHPSDVLALEEDWFAYHIPPVMLRDILRQHGIELVWELRQEYVLQLVRRPRQRVVPPHYEMDLYWLIARATEIESCWTSEHMDWLVYTSHEHSITLGGDWLLQEVKLRWPGWKDHVYAGYEFDLPPPW